VVDLNSAEASPSGGGCGEDEVEADVTLLETTWSSDSWDLSTSSMGSSSPLAAASATRCRGRKEKEKRS